MKKLYIYLILVITIAIAILCIPLPWGGLKYPKYKPYVYIKNRAIKIFHDKGIIPLNKKVCYENLTLIHETMEDLDIEFWLSDGTALGFKRNNDFIDHDNDVDIGFFSRDSVKFWKNLKKFKNKGFQLAEIRSNGTFLVLMRKNEKIDIDITGKGLLCDQCTNEPCEIILPYLESFDDIDIKGKKFNIPKEDYIEFKYGNDWRTPIKKKRQK